MVRGTQPRGVNQASSAGNAKRDESPRPSGSLVVPRAIARGIDCLLVGLPFALIGVLLGEPMGIGFLVALLLASYLYEAIAVARFGATVGKAWMGLEVVDAASGGRPQLSQAGTRILFVLGVAGAISVFLPVGPAVAVFLWGSAAVAVDGRGLPDVVARTTVVRRDRRPKR